MLALAEWSGVNRAPLRNYLLHGMFPDPDVLARLADKLEVPAAHLWAKWLDLGMSDPLNRIADALERAYPPIDPTQASGLRDPLPPVRPAGAPTRGEGRDPEDAATRSPGSRSAL